MDFEDPAFRAGSRIRPATSGAATLEHWMIFAVIGAGMALGCAALLMRLA